MLDRIEDENGATIATRTLAYVGRIMNWHASRSDDFRSPIERGVARVSAKERARDRVLDDDELKAVWRAAEATEGLFGRLVSSLSGCRRSEAPGMARSELNLKGQIGPFLRRATR
jgi:integrase